MITPAYLFLILSGLKGLEFQPTNIILLTKCIPPNNFLWIKIWKSANIQCILTYVIGVCGPSLLIFFPFMCPGMSMQILAANFWDPYP